MKKFYISTFLASILLITSCAEEKGPAPASSPCTNSVSGPPGAMVNVTHSDGSQIRVEIPESGTFTYPCDAVQMQ